MIPKKFKLSIKEFPKRSTTCFEEKGISLKKSQNNLAYTRFGVVASKKVSPKATIRNWAKRIIYDFFAEHKEKIPIGLDLLVIIATPIIETNLDTKNLLWEELEKGIKTLTK